MSFLKNQLRVIYPAMGAWTHLVLALVVIACPAFVLAHNSTNEVETQIDTRERYMELTDQVAPVFILQDTEAHPVRLDNFRGKVVILNFLYSRCEEDCPLHSFKLAEVQQQLALASLSDRVQIITIATDTEDAASTAESMRAHGQRYGLNPANWVYLQGGKGLEDLGMRFAAAYGLKFVPTDDGEQMHGVVTFLIDTKGKLRARYHGLNFNPVNLTIHAAALVHDIHNRDDERFLTDAAPPTDGHSIGLITALTSLGVLACMTFYYYWNRRHRRRLPAAKTPVSPAQEEK